MEESGVWERWSWVGEDVFWAGWVGGCEGCESGRVVGGLHRSMCVLSIVVDRFCWQIGHVASWMPTPRGRFFWRAGESASATVRFLCCDIFRGLVDTIQTFKFVNISNE